MGIDRKISAVRRGGINRQVMALLLLIAFAFQSYLTQTHIHETAPARSCASLCVTHAPSSPLGDAAACPLCQAVVHAGAFLTPATLTATLLLSWVESLVLMQRNFALRAIFDRHGLSRAPPR